MAKFWIVLFALAAATPAAASAVESPKAAACGDPAGHLLDFTVGTWKVTTKDGNVDGHNRIQRVLNGCAIFENWEGTTAGDVGKSLFSYDARSHRWSQVWVLPDTSSTGELVQYELISVYPDDSVRFAGMRFGAKGLAQLQRTTLIPIKNGGFRQVIEASRDGGNVWNTSYDAVYSAESESQFATSPPLKDDPMPCRAQLKGHALDFWIGNWNVADARTGSVQGSDRVERVLDGCAVIETWRGVEAGDEGTSLFTYNAKIQHWDQIWVTPDTSRPGGLKSKHLIATLPGGGTRFQGNSEVSGGDIVLDRTTLTPADDGRVHQRIETSDDGGTTWTTGFDAIYSRA